MDGDASNDFEHIQDVLGQLTALKVYMHMALGFAVEMHDDIVSQELQRAAERLVQSFPYLKGHVIRRGNGPGKTGLATVVPYPEGNVPSLVILKDCRHLCPSMDTIISAGAPMDMLDGEILARRKAAPHNYDESELSACVLEIQANFIQGGVILVFQGNHSIMDMNGMGHTIYLYAKALRKEPFTKQEIEQGNQDRRNIVKLLDQDQLPDMDRYTPVEKQVAASKDQTPSADVRWVYIHVPASNLVKLKTLASKLGHDNCHTERLAPWITTDDALSAWICQRILVARLSRLRKAPKATKATICRAVNARRFLDPPIPNGYMGHAVTCAYTEVPLDDLAEISDLSGLACRMRCDVLALNSHGIQSFATKLNALDDKGQLSFGAQLDCAAFDIVVSSWSGLELGTTQYGNALGKPAFAKRPKLSSVESLIYLMPKTSEGHVDVACCLRNEDIVSLQNDMEFKKYGTYRG